MLGIFFFFWIHTGGQFKIFFILSAIDALGWALPAQSISSYHHETKIVTTVAIKRPGWIVCISVPIHH
jgi:hypothetical protein